MVEPCLAHRPHCQETESTVGPCLQFPGGVAGVQVINMLGGTRVKLTFWGLPLAHVAGWGPE